MLSWWRRGCALGVVLALSTCTTGAAFSLTTLASPPMAGLNQARYGPARAWRSSSASAPFVLARAGRENSQMSFSRLRMQTDMDEPSWPSDSSGAVASPPMSPLYQCPQCKSGISLDDGSCGNCGAPIEQKASFVDLTPEATSKKSGGNSFVAQTTRNPFFSVALSQIGAQLSGQPLRQELFRTPVVSYLYERGWRESFAQAGFPGIEKEYELAMDFFRDVAKGKTVMDLSCGSGLMVRRLAKSNFFGKVVAVDYSESMLEEVNRRKKEEQCPDFDLVRADVAKLPFVTDSFEAIHSGAALHCWPYVQDGLKVT